MLTCPVLKPSTLEYGKYLKPKVLRTKSGLKDFKLKHIYVMIFLLKRRLCIKIDFYDNSQVLDFYDYESHKIIQINHFLIFTWSKKSLLDFYS